jgi:hypothetical protein
MQSIKRLTRGQAAAYLREHGIPIGDSTLDKLCMRAVNQGPPVAAWWGRRPLYDPDQVLAWAEARLRLAEPASARPAEKPVGTEAARSEAADVVAARLCPETSGKCCVK